ncbi:tRNA threonylcarbamoyl adenosine modification protein YeaZ [Metamycoplasma subdolum]|uniref:tRNA threonylcarbamoyl adenosine modification protein YeaZ n=1 Tax=Metamycoplasma subdolum TaxID=92407 RepID=A0A3M0AH39_9BACT|nr:tRNA (adenosine(37)-N6)-threonylcarbamoyltransferase complex dimerization subunit type 1 TsaB [Metamycoplasma subdolum]RMA78552.1 tRNA threonylcarbamoyl adenosine modification protein YeaZ [Metamycoplasma subdolum]WPB50484.1 tRNA (adenosine(37)-N6)-threonylcarbamoyltransferase complex dimerization subunit type 1 TsaB [Metamycoplasma subdolum]
MKMFLETSLEDLYIALISGDFKLIKSIRKEKLIKKTDALFDVINALFENLEYSINDVKEFYITTGPGSFTGARVALLFARTIAQVKNVKLFTNSTYELFKKDLELQDRFDNKVLIKANSHNVYLIEWKGEKITSKLIENEGNYNQFDYKNFELNLKEFLTTFKEEKDLLNIDLLYLHDTQIGKVK